MRNSTLVLLIKKEGEDISQICLAMKKRGFGVNRWNGVGGKLEGDETIEHGAERETEEEISVDILELKKVAENDFFFPHKPEWDQRVHIFFCEKWIGEPKESEEMKPQWFDIKDIPFDSMWPDDIFWLPEVLKGNLLKGKFVFGEGDIIKEKEIKLVSEL